MKKELLYNCWKRLMFTPLSISFEAYLGFPFLFFLYSTDLNISKRAFSFRRIMIF